MTIADLTPATRARLESSRYDSIVEKHEGPFTWEFLLDDGDGACEFLCVGDADVLLPVGKENHPNIEILRAIPSADGSSLTLFLKDTTWTKEEPRYEFFTAGFMAVCDRFPGETFFVAVVYHEWFLLETPFAPDVE